MVDQEEMKLAVAAVAGDLDGFGELCQRYYGPMVAIAYSVVGDHHLAEDAVQEAFAKALGGLRKLKRADRFSPWLTQICRNVAKDMAKAKTVRISTVGMEDIGQLPEKPGDDGTDQAVRRAISKLGGSAREMIVLRYYDNLSYERISAALGISKAAVNSRLKRAKRKLAIMLQRNGLLED